MSQQGLRFTLDVDGLLAMSTAVVRFTLCQNLSTPFTLSVDIASGLPDLTAEDFLEKNATLTVWQGNGVQRRLSAVITGVELGENNDWQMNYHLTLSPPSGGPDCAGISASFSSRISRPSPPPCSVKTASPTGPRLL
jgi:type VI secretion system secreted protein VgrG